MFRLLGFDVHVRTGFVIFLALIVFLYSDGFGLWLAGSLAGFTLLHELGHAVAARSAGAEAEISLDFLAGYTSFRPDPARPLRRARRALISVAGPATQIVTSVAILLAMGVDPLSIDSVRAGGIAAQAIWWAGPAIGAMNLIPVLPLDGGHLALVGIEGIAGRKAFRYMVIASLVMTASGAILLFLGGLAGFGIFVAFLLINQLQMLQATGRRGQTATQSRPANAEAHAWETGRPAMLEPGQRLSPWFEAHRALLQGDAGGAMGVMLADLRSTKVPRWAPPSAATREQLRAIVDVLPRDLPAGNVHSARILADVLLALGEYQRAGEYAAAAFGQLRASPLAVAVARAAAATGDDENALRWLGAAVETAAEEPEPYQLLLTQTMDGAPELAHLRATDHFRLLRGQFV